MLYKGNSPHSLAMSIVLETMLSPKLKDELSYAKVKDIIEPFD